MIANLDPPSAKSPLLGLWILIGVACFEIGFPVLFHANRAPLYFQAGLMPLPLLALAGFRWPRALAVLVSLALAFYFCAWTFGEGALWKQIIAPDNWHAAKIIELSGPVPAVGYALCGVLLILPAVNSWQQFVRPVAADRSSLTTATTPDDGTPKQACTGVMQLRSARPTNVVPRAAGR